MLYGPVLINHKLPEHLFQFNLALPNLFGIKDYPFVHVCPLYVKDPISGCIINLRNNKLKESIC